MRRRGVTLAVDFDSRGRSPLNSEAFYSTTALTPNAATRSRRKQRETADCSSQLKNGVCLPHANDSGGQVLSEFQMPGVAIAKLFQGSLCGLTDLNAGLPSGPQRDYARVQTSAMLYGAPNRATVQLEWRAPPFLRNEAQA
jgi:hypothetical protein